LGQWATVQVRERGEWGGDRAENDSCECEFVFVHSLYISTAKSAKKNLENVILCG
jgi:hypothetical protein